MFVGMDVFYLFLKLFLDSYLSVISLYYTYVYFKGIVKTICRFCTHKSYIEQNEYILYFTSLYNCCQIIFTLNFVLSQRFRKGHYT